MYVISQLELTAGQIRNSQVWEGGEETSSIPEANSIAAHKGSLTSLANSAQNSSRATYPNTSFGFSLPSTTGLGGDPTHPYAYDMGGIPSLDNPGATTPIYQGYNPTPTALPRPSTFLFDDANNDTPPPTVQAAKSSEWSTGVEDDSLPPPEYSDSASSFGHESANAYSPGW